MKDTHSPGPRIIVQEDGTRTLIIISQAELEVVSSPRRQQILKILKASPRPLHGKEIADMLSVKAPSAHFHLQRLMNIGAVRVCQTKVINGITTRYYEAAVDEICMEEMFASSADEEGKQKALLLYARTFDEAKASFLKAFSQAAPAERDSASGEPMKAALSHLLFLSIEEEASFQQEMKELLLKYAAPRAGCSPYSLFVSIAPMSLPPDSNTKEDDGK